jgi:hypothetical protein
LPEEIPEKLSVLGRMVADRAADPNIHRRKICIFLGAGADVSSGGLTFAELKHRSIERFSSRAIFDLTPIESIDRDFERLFSRLEPDERALLIEALFRQLGQLEPSEAYKLLILLVEAGGIDAVVTTNFDLMLERAQEQLGRDVLQVFSPGFARPYPRGAERYDLPKVPYLKLHGDLASKAVVALVRSELDDTRYDRDTQDLLALILGTHDLILAGYGGWDPALAKIIADAIEASRTRIYWCNPSAPSPNAPLAIALGERIDHIKISFDALVAAIARPVLEKPSLIPTELTFVRSLFDWRTEYCNAEYAKLYGTRSHKDITDTFARRSKLEDALTRFLMPNKPLVLVTGPSGYGKTTLGLRLLKNWSIRDGTKILLLRARSFPENGDVEQHVGQQLGGLGFRSPFSLFRFERWLGKNNIQLVLFIDGINEFADDLGRCTSFLRGILRFCYFLPEQHSSLRVIATIRQETWNAMLPQLDLAQLQKTAWSPAGPDQPFNTLACDAFSDEELYEAVRRMNSRSLTVADLETISASSLERLKDPYLLRVVAETSGGDLHAIPSASQFKSMIDAKLRATNTLGGSATLQQSLATAALTILEGKRQRFRETDINPAALRFEILRIARDLDIVRNAEQGFLQFDHDRTFEYFLAVALASGLGPPLETLSDLQAYLRRFHNDSRALAAARLHFELHPDIGLRLVSEGLRHVERQPKGLDSIELRVLYEFGREVLVQLAEFGDRLAKTYLADAIEAGRSAGIGELHLKAVVQAASQVPTDAAFGLLSRVSHPTSYLPRIEAQIYATDRLARRFLESATQPIDLLRDIPYRTFFADESLAAWQRVGRLAGLAMQLGPDNTHPDEYAVVSAAIQTALSTFAGEARLERCDPLEFANFFLANCDRLLFNSTAEGIRRFFSNARRSDFAEILTRLAQGDALDEGDFARIEPYTQSIEFDIEYQLSLALFIVSSLNDLSATLGLVEAIHARLGENANPVQIDFLQALVVYLHVFHDLDYDERRFAKWEETILRDWPAVLLHRPGIVRGERRGFSDPFDRVFEDGFGVIYPYGILLPAKRRQSLYYDQYVRVAFDTDVSLPLYRQWLEAFLKDNRLEESLQVLQCLSSVIVSWPAEGLSTMRPAIGHPDPRIRRAVVRVLAEAYNRHPAQTMRFLRVAGVAINDDELLEIKVRSDARLGRRQIAEEEWARLGHVLLMMEGARETLLGSLFDLVTAETFEAAVEKIFRRLGWAREPQVPG